MSAMPSRGTIVEGIGDDLIYSLPVFLGVVVPLGMLILRSRSQREQTIHPESEDAVNSLRTRLREQNRHGPQAEPSGGQQRNGQDQRCPICLDNTHYAIETNCGHVFCGTCITTYWRHGSWLGAVACPVCRQRVTILLFNFTEEERNTDSTDKTETVNSINEYNRRFSGEPRSVIDYLRDLPTLLRHCIMEFFSVSGLIVMFRIRVIICFLVALIYFISPLDIIPEAAFGILGFLDDFFILLLLAIYISIIYRQYVTRDTTA